MSLLVVTSHPDSASLTAAVAAALAEGAREAGLAAGDIEIADLTAEGFQPAFTAADRLAFHRKAPVPADVAAEQRRIDRAEALALVFPVYWWSMPALLKGWIDRVFTGGWAFAESDGGITPLLRDRPVHVIGLAAADAGAFARHGHTEAFDSQIRRGIFGYCGLRSVTTTLMHDSDTTPDAPARHLATARRLGRELAATLQTRIPA